MTLDHRGRDKDTEDAYERDIRKIEAQTRAAVAFGLASAFLILCILAKALIESHQVWSQ